LDGITSNTFVISFASEEHFTLQAMCELVGRSKTVDNTDKSYWFHKKRRRRIFKWIIMLEGFLMRINSDFIPAFVTMHEM
jgi:hypothetical protein